MTRSHGLRARHGGSAWSQGCWSQLAAGGWGLLQAFSSDAIDSWIDAALVIGAAYGLYLCTRFALAGALPDGMEGRKAD